VEQAAKTKMKKFFSNIFGSSASNDSAKADLAELPPVVQHVDSKERFYFKVTMNTAKVSDTIIQLDIWAGNNHKSEAEAPLFSSYKTLESYTVNKVSASTFK